MSLLFKDSEEDYKHSIILVEDDDDIANILAGHFKLANLRVYKTKSAEECLEIMKDLDDKVDLVLVNGKIAADRGTMLLTNLKKLNLETKIFVLAENDSDKTRVLSYGADEFTTKPISPTTTVEKAIRLLMRMPSGAKTN